MTTPVAQSGAHDSNGLALSESAAASAVTHPTEAPPTDRVERYETRAGYVWIPGRWTWPQGKWLWVEGSLERERPNSAWVAGRWEPRGNEYVWTDGHWAPVRGGES